MKILLHMCCAPCSVYPVEVLREKQIEFEGYFYNPNIHPVDEHKRRKENVKIFSEKENMKVYYDDEYKEEVWAKCSDKGKRCKMCYDTRIEKTAKFASENGFSGFTTSLLVSPYQNHEYIKEVGEKLSKKYKIEFVYIDFRSGFREGQRKAKEMGLYRQKYCGCIKSLNGDD